MNRAEAALAHARRIPSASMSSVVSLSPAVSMKRNRMPSKVSIPPAYPGSFQECLKQWPCLLASRALSRVDLPRLGAPRMATGTPSAMARPVEKPTEQLRDAIEQACYMFPITIAVHKLHVFLAKVEFQFHQGGVFDQGLAKGVDLIAEPAAELLDGQLMGTGMFGIDEVANGLGLGKVSFAVQKGALGEFSGQRRAATGIDQTLHQPLSDERAAVNVAFYNVFPGKLFGPRKGQEQGFIEGLSPSYRMPQAARGRAQLLRACPAQAVDHGQAWGPLMRTTATPPRPGGVDRRKWWLPSRGCAGMGAN